MTHSLLSVANLAYRYGSRTAVCDATFELRHGECFGLLGPNGAGKSTTIACLAGLLAGWTGNMKFEGEDFNPAKNLPDRARVGYVPQELALYPSLTAQENLEVFADLYGLSKHRRNESVERSLEIAGLVDRRHDLVNTFSGGMQRRLNLAIGLIHQPGLLLLDEPTAGVDPQSRNHLFATIETLKESGCALLYTTHYMEEAQRLCDRIAIMNGGQIVATGTAQELALQADAPEDNLEHVFLHLTGRSLRD